MSKKKILLKKNKKLSQASSWYDLRAIYEEMEQDLVKSLKRNLMRHVEDEKKEGFKYEMWQSAKLRDIQRLKEESKEIIKRFRPRIKDVIRNSIYNAFGVGVDKVTNEARNVSLLEVDKDIGIELPKPIRLIIQPKSVPLTPGQEVLLENSKRAPEEVFFRTDNDKVEAIIKEAERVIEKPTANILRYQEDQYRQILFKTQFKLANGTLTLEQAIDQATADFLRNGIANIRYRDGKSVNIADYVAMCLRTANHKAFLAGQGEKRKELGVTTVLVSQHGTACPLCIPWQNEILIDDVFSGGKQEDGPYQLVSKAMSEGLLHVNCMHDLLTYFDGITKRPKTIDPTVTEEKYELKQELRKLERDIRKQKRIVAGTVDVDNYNRESKKLKYLEQKYKDFLKGHKEFREDKNRLRVQDIDKNGLKELGAKLNDEAIKELNSTITANGIKINGVSKHFIERLHERGLSVKDTIEALKNPMDIGNIKYKDNKPSIEFIGKLHRIQVNPETGNIITGWKTSSKLRRKYLGDDYELEK